MSVSSSERRAQWKRFAAWESEVVRKIPDDLRDTLAWMSAAWDLARRHDPRWGTWESAEPRCHELARRRAMLARLVPVR